MPEMRFTTTWAHRDHLSRQVQSFVFFVPLSEQDANIERNAIWNPVSNNFIKLMKNIHKTRRRIDKLWRLNIATLHVEQLDCKAKKNIVLE